MIRMAVTTIGPPSDDYLRMKLVDEFLNIVRDGVDVLGQRTRDGAKFAIIEIEEDGRLDTEFLAGAGGFGATCDSERFTGRNFCKAGGSFFASSGDGEVDVNTFMRVVRQSRSGENFVVGMPENSQEDARLRWSSLSSEKNGTDKQCKQ